MQVRRQGGGNEGAGRKTEQSSALPSRDCRKAAAGTSSKGGRVQAAIGGRNNQKVTLTRGRGKGRIAKEMWTKGHQQGCMDEEASPRTHG